MSGVGFNNVGGIAVDSDGTIYASEISFQRVQRLRPDGSFVAKYDIGCAPSNLAIAGEWVDVTCEKGLVSINKKSGEIRQSIVSNDQQQLISPTGLTYGPDGALYVLDGNLIKKFTVLR
jgi:hypothetical protein